MLERAERLHRHFFTHAETAWEPPIDIFEVGRDLLIIIALPGVPENAVQVLSGAGSILIRGERPMPIERGTSIRRLEIPYGKFERRIDLPPGQYEVRDRRLADGCLTLALTRVD